MYPTLSLLCATTLLPLPLVAQQDSIAPPAADNQYVSDLTESFNCLERSVIPALLSVRDEASADTAAAQLENAPRHIRRIAHVLVDDLSLEEQKIVLPMLAPRMQQLLAQLDSCCSRSADLLSHKPAALGSERLAHALTKLLDSLMGVPEGTTTPEDIPLALAEADAQVAAAGALLSSLERLQDKDSVDRELPTIRTQLDDLRALQRALSDTQRWSKVQLFLIMQRTRERGSAVFADLGKCTALLMGQTPPCYGSAELEMLLTELLGKQ